MRFVVPILAMSAYGLGICLLWIADWKIAFGAVCLLWGHNIESHFRFRS